MEKKSEARTVFLFKLTGAATIPPEAKKDRCMFWQWLHRLGVRSLMASCGWLLTFPVMCDSWVMKTASCPVNCRQHCSRSWRRGKISWDRRMETDVEVGITDLTCAKQQSAVCQSGISVTDYKALNSLRITGWKFYSDKEYLQVLFFHRSTIRSSPFVQFTKFRIRGCLEISCKYQLHTKPPATDDLQTAASSLVYL